MMIKAFIGCFIVAIGVNAGFIPVNLFSVGFQGIGVLGLYTFNVNAGLIVFVLNIPIFILARKKFGREFLVKNIIVTAVLTCFLDLLYPIHSWFHIPIWLGILIGGTFLGIGTGIIFRQGLTSGGVGLLAQLIQLKYPNLKIGTFHIIFDFFILLLGAILTDVMTAFYTFIASFVSGRVMDFIKYFPPAIRVKSKNYPNEHRVMNRFKNS